MERIQTLALLALSLALSSCGVKTVQLRKIESIPKENPMDVEIFINEKPDRPYIAMATLQEDNGSYEDVLNGFRRRAAQIGADAVIVEKNERYDDKSFWWGTVETKRYITGTAIKWKAAEKSEPTQPPTKGP